MKDNLRENTIKALVWSSVERFGQQGIMFIITIILARLLTPNDYGLIGLLMVFIVVAEAVVNSGFAQALIQKKTVDDDDLTTAFVISFLAALFLYLIVYFSAGAIATFYQQPDLIMLTRVLAIVIVLDALVIIQRTIFERNLNFKHLSHVTLRALIWSSVERFGNQNDLATCRPACNTKFCFLRPEYFTGSEYGLDVFMMHLEDII